MKKIQLIVFFLFFLAHGLCAVTITASSPLFSDVQTAVDLANDGDTVKVPFGTEVWYSTLLITKSIILKGDGIGRTTIKNGKGSNDGGNFILFLRPLVPADNPYIEITGFTLDGNGVGACISINAEDKTFSWNNFRIHHNRIINTPNAKDSYMSIRIKGNCFGLIDSNYFDNNYYDFKIYGNDQNSWDEYPGLANMGSKNFIYIENNISTNCISAILTSGEGARWVYRYNEAETNVGVVMDAHGNTQNDGVVASEAYNNTFTGKSKISDLRGGIGVYFNNIMNREGDSGLGRFQIREEDATRSQPASTAIDPITNSYIWNIVDSYTGLPFSLFESDDDTINLLEQNRDYWSDVKAINSKTWLTPNYQNPESAFTWGPESSRPDFPKIDDCYWSVDTKKLYRRTDENEENEWTHVYSPYLYPHPLSTLSTLSTLRKPIKIRISK